MDREKTPWLKWHLGPAPGSWLRWPQKLTTTTGVNASLWHSSRFGDPAWNCWFTKRFPSSTLPWRQRQRPTPRFSTRTHKPQHDDNLWTKQQSHRPHPATLNAQCTLSVTWNWKLRWRTGHVELSDSCENIQPTEEKQNHRGGRNMTRVFLSHTVEEKTQCATTCPTWRWPSEQLKQTSDQILLLSNGNTFLFLKQFVSLYSGRPPSTNKHKWN